MARPEQSRLDHFSRAGPGMMVVEVKFLKDNPRLPSDGLDVEFLIKAGDGEQADGMLKMLLDYPDISSQERTAAIERWYLGAVSAATRARRSTFLSRSKRRLKRHS